MADILNDEPTQTIVDLDSRKRAVLPMGHPSGRYLAHLEPGGTIVLEPAVVMTELEAAIQRNPDIMRQLKIDSEKPRRAGRQRPKRSF